MWRSIAIFALLAYVQAQGKSKDFPPGWNGMARTPPLGWRSWNAFGNRISQALMVEQIDAIVAKNRTVKGWDGEVSLCDLGYCSVGIDEGWEGCGMGVPRTTKDGKTYKTQHYANGTPAINPKFPDIAGLVKYGHSRGLKMGWYENGCACGEKIELTINYEGDVKLLHDFGFDAVKLDGCGAQRNMTLYAQLMKESGKNYSIENCHWGRCTPADDSSCPTRDWCPFNWYRSSGDINAGHPSWYSNLQTTIRFQSWDAPVSQPGCWAYPDMLEVGRVDGSVGWNRAHFGAWCIVSAPLVLGMDLTDAKLAPVLDVIGNKLAVSINQAWAGHPGSLVRTLPDPPAPSPKAGSYATGVKCDQADGTQSGWSVGGGTIRHGGLCLDAKDRSELRLMPCDGSAEQSFAADATGKFAIGGGCLDIFGSATCRPVVDRRVDVYACNGGANQLFDFDSSTGVIKSKCGECLAARATSPSGGGSGGLHSQLWAKPIEGGAVAALFINAGEVARSITIHLSELNITTAAATVTDVWDAGKLMGKTTGGAFTTVVNGTDSAFLIFTPAPAKAGV